MTTPLLLLLCLCLVLPSLGTHLPYIIGGTDVTDATKYPFHCFLMNDQALAVCGATLISPSWFVTDARCLSGNPVTITCGEVGELVEGQARYFSQIIMHEDFDNGTGVYPNDIAVIRVSAFNVTDSRVAPIPMWNSATDPAGNADCIIMGRGPNREGDDPRYLQEAKINVYTVTECEATWGPAINSGHVCAGDTTHSRAPCGRDIGGPVICKDSGEYKLVGVWSWGANCNPAFPSVYSRISYFRDWIRGKTGV